MGAGQDEKQVYPQLLTTAYCPTGLVPATNTAVMGCGLGTWFLNELELLVGNAVVSLHTEVMTLHSSCLFLITGVIEENNKGHKYGQALTTKTIAVSKHQIHHR